MRANLTLTPKSCPQEAVPKLKPFFLLSSLEQSFLYGLSKELRLFAWKKTEEKYQHCRISITSKLKGAIGRPVDRGVVLGGEKCCQNGGRYWLIEFEIRFEM